MNVRKPKPLPQTPTPELVERYSLQFQQNDKFGVDDRAIFKLVGAMPRNKQLEEILLKVIAINSLYSTQIYATRRMAEHIHRLQVDDRLQRAEARLVDEIASLKLGEKTWRFYSFASKYCSFHNPNEYPIFDRFVQAMLVAYRNHYGFAKFKVDELRQYRTFKAVMETFRDHFGLQRYSMKDLDRFLWLYGVELEIA